MKHLIPVFCFLLIAGCGPKASIEDEHKRNGLWVWWVDAASGKGEWIPENSSGHPVTDGKFTRFYINGNIYEAGTLRNGKKVDTTYNYDINGKLYGYVIPAKDGARVSYFIKDGLYTLYFNDGKLLEHGFVKKHFSDSMKRFYYNGKVELYRNLTQGSGWVNYYFENGLPYKIVYVRDRHGESFEITAKEWAENGRLKYSHEMNNGFLNGVTKHYWSNGNLLDSTFYINDKMEGTAKEWYEDGKLKGIISYKNNFVDGEAIKYDKQGKVVTVAVFDKGIRVR